MLLFRSFTLHGDFVESTRLVESSIRLKYGIEGGCLHRNSRVYLGTTLFKPSLGPCLYVFTGGTLASAVVSESAAGGGVDEASTEDSAVPAPTAAPVAVPGMGWTRKKSRKCPCCT